MAVRSVEVRPRAAQPKKTQPTMPPRRKKDPPSFKPSAETLKNFQMPEETPQLELLPSGPKGDIPSTYTGECRALNQPAVLPPPPPPSRKEERPSASRFWTSFAAAAARATKKKSGDAQHWAPARPPPPPPDRRAGQAKKKSPKGRPKVKRGLSDEGRTVFADATTRNSDELPPSAFPAGSDFAAAAAAAAASRDSFPPRFSWDDPAARSSSKSVLSDAGSVGARHSLAQQESPRHSRNWQQYHAPVDGDPLEVPANFSWADGMALGSFADDDGIDLGPLDLSN